MTVNADGNIVLQQTVGDMILDGRYQFTDPAIGATIDVSTGNGRILLSGLTFSTGTLDDNIFLTTNGTNMDIVQSGTVAFSAGADALITYAGTGTFRVASGTSSFDRVAIITMPTVVAAGATLTFNAGATLEALTLLGTLEVNNGVGVAGVFSNQGTIDINLGGALVLTTVATNAGAINIAAGGSLSTNNNPFTNASTGVIAGDSFVIVGTGIVFTNQGTLRPGASGGTLPGTLTILGDLVLTPTSVVQIAIQTPGLVAGTDFSTLSVSGAVTLGGNARRHAPGRIHAHRGDELHGAQLRLAHRD